MSEEQGTTKRGHLYLAEIYRLSDYDNNPEHFVSTSSLAEIFNVSAPAVNRMVARLKEQGFLEHEPYKGIRLTDEGRRIALQQLRNHRIAESFLVNVMGFSWHEIHEEAQRMSSALSDVLAERMLEMSNYPTTCPHGEPIPAPDGTMPPHDDQPLTAVEINKDYIITRVRTRESDRLEYMAALGLTPGRRFTLIHVAPFNGPMQLKLDREYRIIGHNLAELIRVKPAEN